jgi:hypothetical protein
MALALERAGVKPREGDAQKALRRSYITSALICGRNPKLVASEVGHTTARMVLETYDSFIDPASWPDAEEREHLAQIFGWDGDEIVGSNSHATQSPLRLWSAKPLRVIPRRGSRMLEHETGLAGACRFAAGALR